ncbi:hypothetical protein GY45DRAFT_782850 [Cubamyces sp. BRFM 1775]|nr:hypothetical protein GY45DRAFT_782850 [Cubamyces sp. BRFM 1775]
MDVTHQHDVWWTTSRFAYPACISAAIVLALGVSIVCKVLSSIAHEIGLGGSNAAYAVVTISLRNDIRLAVTILRGCSCRFGYHVGLKSAWAHPSGTLVYAYRLQACSRGRSIELFRGISASGIHPSLAVSRSLRTYLGSNFKKYIAQWPGINLRIVSTKQLFQPSSCHKYSETPSSTRRQSELVHRTD